MMLILYDELSYTISYGTDPSELTNCDWLQKIVGNEYSFSFDGEGYDYVEFGISLTNQFTDIQLKMV